MAIKVPYQYTVYRLYDANGALLYVGSSKNIATRIQQHRSGRPWWDEVEEMKTDAYTDQKEAREAESAYIRDLGPRYNIYHNDTGAGAAPVEVVAAPLKLSRRGASFGGSWTNAPRVNRQRVTVARLCSDLTAGEVADLMGVKLSTAAELLAVPTKRSAGPMLDVSEDMLSRLAVALAVPARWLKEERPPKLLIEA